MSDEASTLASAVEEMSAETAHISHQTVRSRKGEQLNEQEQGLTKSEAGRLQELETTIERGQQTFVEVGQALLEIRDSRLYRETHETFNGYCNDRWGINKSYAYRLMTASGIASDVVRMGTLDNPRQAYELARAPEAQRAEIWERVQDQAEKVTAKVIRQEVDRTLGVTSPVKDVTPTYEATTSTGRQVTIRLEPAVAYMKGLDAAIRTAERASADLPDIESKLSDFEKDALLFKLRTALRALDPGRDDRIYKRVAVVGERKVVNR